MFDYVVAALGLVAGIVIFFRHPRLPRSGSAISTPRISVIIPARNEAENLPHLLESLRAQSLAACEILCVDDGSEDDTAAVARSFGVRTVSLSGKPEGWTGKSWACRYGAARAAGDLLLFLDADVRFGPDAIAKLYRAYTRKRSVVSVQPYHCVERLYEHFSLFFNLVLIAANGVGWLFRRRNLGLFGPVILMEREAYLSVNGHEAARESVLEDLALGTVLGKRKISYELFVGDHDISFRMYGGGLRHLREGWTKSFATGAAMTPVTVFIPIFLWITGCISIFKDLVEAAAEGDPAHIAAAAALYLLAAVQIAIVSRRIGSFRVLAVFFYPAWLAGFIILFLESVMKKIVRGEVVWKRRKIRV
jgi:4,4'-diaponeurosporenoate glycosyltransferase